MKMSSYKGRAKLPLSLRRALPDRLDANEH